MMHRGWMSGFAAAALSFVALAVVAYRHDVAAARERVRDRATTVASPYGAIEYLEGGAGIDVLIVHGAGGGFDQGELIAEMVLDEDVHWIAPSRFGYLGSTSPPGATHEDQVRAYAWLLDRLGIDRVAVVGLSAGGHSAALLAALYPERVTSLTLLSAGVTRAEGAGQEAADAKGRTWVRLFRDDFLFWGATKAFRRQVMGMVGVDDAVTTTLSDEERALANRFVDFMLPVSWRAEGAEFDNTAVPAGERVGAVRAPTLIIHAQDDRLQLFDQAAFAAATIPAARVRSYPQGGHIVGITARASVRDAVLQHVRAHAR